MADLQRNATVDTENPPTVKLAKRQLALRGTIQGSTFLWLEIPVQDHPRAPNPYDRYSKRGWEKAMSAYRHELRELLFKRMQQEDRGDSTLLESQREHGRYMT